MDSSARTQNKKQRSLLTMSPMDALAFSYDVEETYLKEFFEKRDLNVTDPRVNKDLSMHYRKEAFFKEERTCYWRDELIFFAVLDFQKQIYTIYSKKPYSHD